MPASQENPADDRQPIMTSQTTQPTSLTFAFGKNWRKYLSTLREEDILAAQNSLLGLLQRKDLNGVSFLDAGCGSGIFSLAALRLGAQRVVSIDVDPDSVACATQLREHYGPFPQWEVHLRSVLDNASLNALGSFDVVYSWGVLHHTGAMWDAIGNVARVVAPGGQFYLSIYNDQGMISIFWKRAKRIYNQSPKLIQLLIAAVYYVPVMLFAAIRGLSRLNTPDKLFTPERGMRLWYDTVDWVGGYPFETARPEEILHFMRDRGFNLTEMRLKRGSGCNELVFRAPV